MPSLNTLRVLPHPLGPALAPPPGLVPNFVDPPIDDCKATVILVFCLSISSTLIILRACSKLIVARKVNVQDVFGLAAFLNFVGYIACNFISQRNSPFFVHQWNVQLYKMSKFIHLILIGGNFYSANMLCIKVAIVLEWLRIFASDGKRGSFFLASWGILILNTLYYTTMIIAVNLGCIPHRAIWDKSIEGRCINDRALHLASAVINLVSDLGLLALAQMVIWNLQLSLRKKFGVSIGFATGLVGCIAGGFRLAVTVKWLKTEDMTYQMSSVVLWGAAEMTAGILVFCVPALPLLFTKPGIGSRLGGFLSSCSCIESGPTVADSTDVRSRRTSFGLFDRDEVPLTNVSESHENLRRSGVSPPGEASRSLSTLRREANSRREQQQRLWMERVVG